VIAAAAAVLSQAHAHSAPPPVARPALQELVNRPVPLRKGIGSAHDGVSTASKPALAFYDQGLAYLHSFVWLEAARSFTEALRADPKLAMAHLGLSMAYVELNAPAAARAALGRAKALAASDHDRVHVAARALQMAAEDAPRDTAKLAAYRTALDQALTTFPGDVQLWLQRGQAESPDPAERGQGSVAGSIRFYEKALALAPGHFAAHHYLTHAGENSGRTSEALAHGAIYAKMAPAVPHARHMHGHSLRRLGRIDEAIGEFAAADALESAYFAAERVPLDYDWHYQHNLDLLATSYQYDGQMAKAESAVEDVVRHPSSLLVQEFNKREWPVFLLARGGRARRSRPRRPRRAPVAGGERDRARRGGHARLALGQFKAAADEANAALRLMRARRRAPAMVGDAAAGAAGRVLPAHRPEGQGRAMLEEAREEVRAPPGPDAWTQALFTLEAIARAAREVGDWDFAAWAARQMLEHDPNYAGSHLALALVAEHQGDARTAPPNGRWRRNTGAARSGNRELRIKN
jgi:tetratricopeptide (TPR) repeat protein